MSEGTSSCRPARLLRFEGTLDAVADGLAHRRGQLLDALEAYRASCTGDYVVPTEETANVVRSFGSGLRDWGRWIGDVGRAFEDAATAYAFTGSGSTDFEGVIVGDDDELVSYLRDYLDPGEDPYRNVPEGTASDWAARLGIPYDQNAPPAWIDYLAADGNYADYISNVMNGLAEGLQRLPQFATVTVTLQEGGLLIDTGDALLLTSFRTELQASLRLPRVNTAGLQTGARWVSRVGFWLAFATSAGSQWHAGAGQPTIERAARAAGRGGAVAIGASALGVAGFEAGAVCGPLAWACSPTLGIGGALIGAFAGDKLADLVPGMIPPEPRPAEHDLGRVTDDIAAPDDNTTHQITAIVDLAASDAALADATGSPDFRDRVAALLPPDRERLEFMAATGERPEHVTPTGTTTSTTRPQPPPPPIEDHDAPDPWPLSRSYE